MTLACGDGTGTGDAQLTVALTDAPSDYYASAEVDIGAIEILPVDGPPIVLTDAGGTYDLLTLQDGVTADLATLNIEPGTYVQLRMIVDGARVTLASGYEFTDGSTSRELIVPSGALTGIKINLSSADGDGSAGVEIVAGETILIVDFDVNQNFVIQGDPNTPAGIQGVLFTPLLRAVVRDVAGSITGVVTESGSGNPLESLVVRAQLSESTVLEALQTDEATASTQTDGSYIIRFLSPGTYDVSVDDFSAAVQSVTVGEAEAVEGVDFSGTSSP
jgi:hypothetical protein